MAIDLGELTVAVVSTFPPTRCGVGRFSSSLCRVWKELAPGLDLQVNRIVTASDVMAPHPLVGSLFDAGSPTAVRSVVRRLQGADVALVHHEFGIYGPRHGEAVVEMARHAGVPVVSVLHTVLARPSQAHRRIVEALGEAGPLVVPTETARARLLASHRLAPGSVAVVRHGTSWWPTPTRRPPRRSLLTWGLLGPGKGIERALEAVALVDLDPPVTYQVVGQTHPRVRERYGERYRHSLEELTRYLGLERRVRFVDRYLTDEELRSKVAASDLVLLPYDDEDQVCSGTLIDALALGRPVVATSFPHATELVGEGSGRVVGRAPRDMAEAVVGLLEDDERYGEAAAAAAGVAAEHSWAEVSPSYADVLHRALDRHRVG